jgi:hypothetical protein
MLSEADHERINLRRPFMAIFDLAEATEIDAAGFGEFLEPDVERASSGAQQFPEGGAGIDACVHGTVLTCKSLLSTANRQIRARGFDAGAVESTWGRVNAERFGALLARSARVDVSLIRGWLSSLAAVEGHVASPHEEVSM